MKKYNKYISIGLFFNGLFLLGNCTNIIPEFFKGFFVGLGFMFIFLGMYSEYNDISKLRTLKAKIFKK